MRCEPAYSILALFGGPSPVSRALGLAAHTPLRWTYDTEKKGTGGAIPFRYHDQIIELARGKGIDLPRGVFADPALAQDLLHRVREGSDAA